MHRASILRYCVCHFIVCEVCAKLTISGSATIYQLASYILPNRAKNYSLSFSSYSLSSFFSVTFIPLRCHCNINKLFITNTRTVMCIPTVFSSISFVIKLYFRTISSYGCCTYTQIAPKNSLTFLRLVFL